MKKWLFGMALLLVLTLVIRLLANYQQQSHLTQMKVAPAVLEHLDQAVVPAAPAQTADDWQGKTGLSAAVESQFMDFLHLKFAEAKDDPAALQPEDLVYLGVFDQDEGSVRYWVNRMGIDQHKREQARQAAEIQKWFDNPIGLPAKLLNKAKTSLNTASKYFR